MPLTAKKNFVRLPLVQEFLQGTGGEAAVGVAIFCEKKGKRVTDEEIAKKMNTIVRVERRTLDLPLEQIGTRL